MRVSLGAAAKSSRVALADVRAILMIPGVRSQCSIRPLQSTYPYASNTAPSPLEPGALVPTTQGH